MSKNASRVLLPSQETPPPFEGHPWRDVALDLGLVEYRGYTTQLAGRIVCSETPAPHPYRAQIAALHREWAERFELLPPAMVEKLHFWDLWTDCVPEMSPEVASVISDYCLMFTVLDDAAERFFESGSVASLASDALQGCVSVLEGRTPKQVAARAFPKFTELCAALKDLRSRILLLGEPAMYPLFMEGMHRYSRGVEEQIYLARWHLPLSKETQIFNRHMNVAFDPTVVLVNMLAHNCFATRLDQHPLLERAHIAVCRGGAVINDIISFPKETRDAVLFGSCQNLIAAEFADAAQLPNVENPLERAVARTFEFHNGELRDLLVIGWHLGEIDSRYREYTRLGLKMHRSWANWCLTAERYTRAFSSKQPLVSEFVSEPPVSSGVFQRAHARRLADIG